MGALSHDLTKANHPLAMGAVRAGVALAYADCNGSCKERIEEACVGNSTLKETHWEISVEPVVAIAAS